MNLWKFLGRTQQGMSGRSSSTVEPRVKRRPGVIPEMLEGRVMFSTYMVTNLADSGAGSLRQALMAANAHAGPDSVAFSSKLAGTITLMHGQIPITDGVNIVGPGAGRVAVSGNSLTRIFNNTAPMSKPVTISGITLTRGNPGKAAGGGAVRNYGSLNLSADVFTSNVAASMATSQSSGYGGAGLMNYGSATVSNCTFMANAAYAHDDTGLDGGGGIYNAGTLNVTHSLFHANIADTSPDALNPGPDQEATAEGSAIYDSGKLTLTDSTLYGNKSGYAGALAIGPFGSATVVNDTITMNNSGIETGGIWLQFATLEAPIMHSGKLMIGNTIVAANTANMDPDHDDVGDYGLKSAVTSLGHNLIGSTPDTFWKMTDLTGSASMPLNARLGALANNGGPTMTVALRAGSPAIDAGSNSIASSQGLTTDQRGMPRVRFGSVDIGAFEA